MKVVPRARTAGDEKGKSICGLGGSTPKLSCNLRSRSGRRIQTPSVVWRIFAIEIASHSSPVGKMVCSKVGMPSQDA
jgi:hypothetical protein